MGQLIRWHWTICTFSKHCTISRHYKQKKKILGSFSFPKPLTIHLDNYMQPALVLKVGQLSQQVSLYAQLPFEAALSENFHSLSLEKETTHSLKCTTLPKAELPRSVWELKLSTQEQNHSSAAISHLLPRKFLLNSVGLTPKQICKESDY